MDVGGGGRLIGGRDAVSPAYRYLMGLWCSG